MPFPGLFASSGPRTALSTLPIPGSRESPGLAVRGKPVQRDEGPPDLHLSPLHPCAAPQLTVDPSTANERPPTPAFANREPARFIEVSDRLI